MAKEDLTGQTRKQALEDHFHVTDLQSIRHGSLWHFRSESDNIEALKEQIHATNIIYNPYADECYDFFPN